MKWKIEDITEESANILFDDGQSNFDSDAVGIGFPPVLAERLVKLHNEDLEKITEEKNVSEPEIHKLRCPILSCRSDKVDWIHRKSTALGRHEERISTCCRCGHQADSKDFYEENQT